MCAVCSSIPVVAAVGMTLDRKTRHQNRKVNFWRRPVMLVTIVLIAALVFFSSIMHSNA